MENLLIYIVKVNVLLLLVIAFYLLFLKKETFFTAIRFYFLTGISLSVVLPLVFYTQILYVPASNLPDAMSPMVLSPELLAQLSEQESVLNWKGIITAVYLVVAGLGLVVLVRKIYQLVQYIQGLKRWSVDGTIRLGKKNEETYSFWKWMVLPKTFPEVDYADFLIAHEQIHLKQYHTIDVVVMQVLRKLFWFNPLLKELEHRIHLNLEHIVDAEMSKTTDLYGYQMALVNVQQQVTTDVNLVNSFYASTLKRRIVMLNQPKSKNMNRIKLMIPLPVVAGLFFVFQVKVEAKTLAQLTSSTMEDTRVVATDLVQQNNIVNDKEDQTSGTEVSIIGTTGQNSLVISDDEVMEAITAKKIAIEEKDKRAMARLEADNLREERQNKIREEIALRNEARVKELDRQNVKNDERMKVLEAKREKLEEELKGMVAAREVKMKEISEVRAQAMEERKAVIEKKRAEVQDQKEKRKERKTEIMIVNTNDNGTVTNTNSSVFVTKDERGNGKTVTIKGLGGDSSRKIANINIDSGSDDKGILYYVDGKEVGAEEVKGLDTNNIDAITVLKGAHAVSKFGKKAEKGVIEITMK